MQFVLMIGYLVLGLFQLAAVMAGLVDWIGLHWLLAALVAMFIAYIPVVGTVLGIVGAVTAWNWHWLMATALFAGPFLVMLVLALGGAAADGLRSKA
jgi:hypothetical protein